MQKYKDEIKNLEHTALIFIKISAGAGFLVILIYCGKIGYFPSGLTVGDTFLFIASSLSFALIYTLITIGLLFSGIASSPILRWVQPPIFLLINSIRKIQKKPPVLQRINFPNLTFSHTMPALLGLLIIGFNVAAYYKDSFKAFTLTATIFSLSFFWGLLHTKPRRKEYNFLLERRLKLALIFFTYCIPLIIIQSNGGFLNQSMAAIGIRVDSTTVQLTKKYTDYLKINDILPDATNVNGEGLYKNATVSFRGVGSEVAIEIKGFQTSIPSSEIIIGKAH